MATYKVKEDGKAPSGLKAGDKVVTAGGTYTISGVNADGSYTTSKNVDKSVTTKNYTGSYANKTSANGSSSGFAYTPPKTATSSGNNATANGISSSYTYTPPSNTVSANGSTGGYTYVPNKTYSAETVKPEYVEPEYVEVLEELATTSRPSSTTSKRPTYSDPYRSDIDELLRAILTRDNFSYDVNNDPLFAQYKQQYMREGQRAMQDTLANAAANAGGMNSYAITAGQQAQNYYGAQLGDKIPELYDIAYGMYLDDIDNDVRNLGLLNQMSDTQYGRYRDIMGDWENDRDFAYNKYRDDIGDMNYDREWDYMLSRDAIEDARYNANKKSSSTVSNNGYAGNNNGYVDNGYYPDDEGSNIITITRDDIQQTARQMLNNGASEDEISDYLANQIDRGFDPEVIAWIARNFGIEL